MKIPRILTPILLIILALSACSPINGLFGTLTPIPNQTPTPAPTEEPCAYVWAFHGDEEATTLFYELLTKQSLPFIAERTSVYDFGEDCVTASGVNKGFGAMETDFTVLREITAETTNAEIGEYAIAVVKLIAANFDSGKNINARRGTIEFVLLPAGSYEHYYRMSVDEAIHVIEQSITPEDFFKQYFPTP